MAVIVLGTKDTGMVPSLSELTSYLRKDKYTQEFSYCMVLKCTNVSCTSQLKNIRPQESLGGSVV